jgi:hypothetical protein
LVKYPEGFVEKYGFGFFSSNPTIPDSSEMIVGKRFPNQFSPARREKKLPSMICLTNSQLSS